MDFTRFTHHIVVGVENDVAIVAECARTRWGVQLKDLSFATGLNVPQTNGTVSRGRDESSRVPVDVDHPYGAVVSVVRAQPFAIDRIPNQRISIFTGREEKITFAVVTNFRQ